MTREQAHLILDQARAGKDVHPTLIRLALIATGDLARTWGNA